MTNRLDAPEVLENSNLSSICLYLPTKFEINAPNSSFVTRKIRYSLKPTILPTILQIIILDLGVACFRGFVEIQFTEAVTEGQAVRALRKGVLAVLAEGSAFQTSWESYIPLEGLDRYDANATLFLPNFFAYPKRAARVRRTHPLDAYSW